MNIDFSLLNPVDEGMVSQVLVKDKDGEITLELVENGRYKHRALAVNEYLVIIVMESKNTIIPMCIRVCRTVHGEDVPFPIAARLGQMLGTTPTIDFVILEPCVTDEYKN